MRRNNNKSKVIAFLFVALIFMGIGFAVLQSNLNISGTAKASGNFDVEITGVTPQATSSFTKYSATLSPTFDKPGDTVEYTVTVRNNGTIDAMITATLDSSDNIKDSNDNDLYLFEIEYENEKKVIRDEWPYYMLDAGLTTTIKVTITYNSEAVELIQTDVDFELLLSVTQKSSPEAQQEYREFMENHKDFELDANGKIIGFYPSNVTDSNGYVVVGATNYEGNPIRTIDQNSFVPPNNTFMFQEGEDSAGIYIDYPKGSSEYNNIKATLESYGYLDAATLEGTSSNLNDYRLDKLEIKDRAKLSKMDSTYANYYGKGEMEPPSDGFGVYIDAQTGAISLGNAAKKLDLSGANNLETIEAQSFQYGGLQSIIFPTSGRLTTIGEKAFYYNSSLTGNIVLPNTVTSIGSHAFERTSISSVTLPNNLQTIGESVFEHCQLEGALVIPSSVTSIGNSAFKQNRIESLSFANGSHLTSIGNSAFYDNQIEGSLTIPNTVTTIGSSAFYLYFNSLTLTSVTIPSSVTSIGSDAFAGSNDDKYTITSLSIDMETIPLNIFSYKGIETVSIGSHVRTLQGLEGNLLTSVLIPSSVTSIGDTAFHSNRLSTLDLSNVTQVHTISINAFSNNLLTSLTIPSHITDIGAYAFENNQINTLNLSNATSLQTIGQGAFRNNRFMSSLTIPNSVTSIGRYAFKSDSSNPQTITTLTLGTGLTTVGDNAFQYTTTTNLIMPQYVSGVASDFNYKYTGVVNLTIQSGVIPDNAFSHSSNQLNSTVTSLTLGSGVTSIGGSAFITSTSSGCARLTSLTFEGNSQLQTVGASAFANNQISSLTIPNGVTSIGNIAFYGNQISSLTIPSSVANIGAQAFYGNQLSSLTIPSSVTRIESYTFAYNQISSLIIPSSVTSIGYSAFERNQLSSLNLTNATSLETIDDFAFSYNQISTFDFTNATSLQIIGQSAFKNNQLNMSSLTIPNSVTRIEAYAFESNNLSPGIITTLTLGTGLTSVETGVFHNTTTPNLVMVGYVSAAVIHFKEKYTGVVNLTIQSGAIPANVFASINPARLSTSVTSLTIGSGVTSIGDSAFSISSDDECARLTTLTFEGNSQLLTIGNYAFRGNRISGTVTIPNSVTSIGNRAFSGNQIETLNLGSGLTSLGSEAFVGNYINENINNGTSLTTININMTQSTWNSRNLPTSNNWYTSSGNLPTVTYNSE